MIVGILLGSDQDSRMLQMIAILVLGASLAAEAKEFFVGFALGFFRLFGHINFCWRFRDLGKRSWFGFL